MTDPNLELEFLKFQTVADTVYQLVNQKYEALQAILQKAERRIKIESSKQTQSSASAALVSKQNEVIETLQKMLGVIRENIDTRYEMSKDFSIAIYGQNKAGKSTLMEILTHGEGNSIGKGAYRAISDIRSYRWSGLKVTDISGFDFSDEKSAGVAAVKTADLILFLIPNNAVHAEDAEIFAQLKSFGKPIIGVVNVRKILNFKQRDSILQELKKILPNSQAVETAVTNFKNFAAENNQDWTDIKFLPAHLLSAYYAHLDKVNDEEIYNASNFVEVENFIMGKIITDGEFLHIKNFVDGVAFPMNDIILKLFDKSASSLKEAKIWEYKSDEMATWRKNFIGNSQRKISNLANKVSEKLHPEIEKFVNENYNASNVMERWNNNITELSCTKDFLTLTKEIITEFTGKVQQIMDDILQELENSFGGKTQTNLEIEDAKILGSLYQIDLPDFSKIVPKVEVVENTPQDAGVLFQQAFFSSTSQNSSASKGTYIKKISESSTKTFKVFEDETRKILNAQVIPKIDEFSKLLVDYAHMLAQLGESQGETAELLLDEYEGLNSELLKTAIKRKTSAEVTGVKVTMRIPGESFIAIADNLNVDEAEISEFLGEKFYIMESQKSWNATMNQVLGCSFELEEYSLDFKTGDKAYSVLPKEKLTPVILKLAQQISPYPIINP